jgi:hypothetical protein
MAGQLDQHQMATVSSPAQCQGAYHTFKMTGASAAAPSILMMVTLLLLMVMPPQPQPQSPDAQSALGQGVVALGPATKGVDISGLVATWCARISAVTCTNTWHPV